MPDLASFYRCSALVDNATGAEFEKNTVENLRSILKESHLLASGKLDNYSEDNIHDCITLPKAGGVFDCKPRREQDSWPQLLYSPPPVNFGRMLYDTLGVKAYYHATKAMLELRSAVFTNVRPSYTTGGSGRA